ncbi:MAG: glycosyltransferase [Candidatus Latescibacteria bacterium]|nr:glycosyltransferase [Candidatus Latescibacterota bacterium]NIM21099.1 glycosyltransferase [Candidatus Latescibacterota bacterium]NIM65234.1 glycosyltransferase [Candidatus Latescibacterota bacterium]NIO01749.1 glycosyltransferase [Candidatus Latescibacterota bacterium]NIO28266.1 glycosyltransferase [Candidatus Latescibacterota bacterium]
MKLLAVNWRDLKNPDAGGAEVHLHEILSRMVKRGHEVVLFSANFPGGDEEDSYDGIKVFRKGSWYNANYILPIAVRSYLKRNDCDLVIEDINKIPFFLPVFVKQRVLAIVPHLFGSTVFRETNPLFATYVLMWERFIPFVYEMCHFVAISESTKEDLMRRGLHEPRIEVSLCGLDHSTYKLLDGVPRFEEPTIVHFGRIRKYKSIDVVMKAFVEIRKKLENAKLIIAGDGPEKANLERLSAKLGLGDSIRFLGQVKTDALVELLNKSHLFINASSKEGWGLTVLEANACGVPVVASDRPGLKDSVKEGKTGYLVEYGRPDAFAEKALELLSDPIKWNAMSAAALDWARSLTWERTAEEIEKIIIREVS